MTVLITEAGSLDHLLDLPALDPAVVVVCRERAGDLSGRITRRIRAEVAAFATTTDPRIEAAVTEAITCAVDAFMDALARRRTSIRTVFAFYRRLGELQGRGGHDLDAMQAAHQIATQESWDELREMTLALGLPAEVVARVGHAVMTYQRLLLDQAVAGYTSARGDNRSARHQARTQLLVELLSNGRADRIAELADESEWPVPQQIAVAVVASHCSATTSRVLAEHPHVLAGVRRGRLAIVADADEVVDVARHVVDEIGGPVAISWGVASTDVRHAARWSFRALELADTGIITAPDDNIVWCRDHQAHLCLHADPMLRRHADADLLAPLLAERPKRRAALAETMLLWLQTRHSAPVLAEQLGVHEQTVRHRLRHLKAMFADELADPTRTVDLLTALESTTPGWRRAAA